MCGRFALTTDMRVIASRWRAERSPDLPERSQPRDNIKPSQEILTIALGQNGQRRIVPMRWGLVPPWSEDGTPGRLSTINAKAETIATSRLYGPAFRKGHRCLIPFDAFYEWSAATDEAQLRQSSPATDAAERRQWSGPKGVRRPNTIATTANHVMAFAGLWSAWRPRNGEAGVAPQLTCTIVTVAANDKVAELHDRMPAILDDDDVALWLGEMAAGEGELLELLRPWPADRVKITAGATFE